MRKLREQCTPAKKKECAKSCGPANLEAVCAACEHRHKHDPSPWFLHISYLAALVRAGYPFMADDLTIDEWLDIGALREDYEMTIATIGTVRV